jgi:hypothetical protein
MENEYVKTKPILLRDAGKDETWLQRKIEDDPSILGLGNLVVIQNQRMQHTRGRIDLLLEDREGGIRYEVEIMLGQVDESHIIRTIEYWDIEHRGDRDGTYEHKAVIVAEEFIQRFFNVINLLNKAVPMIAVKLSAFRVKSKLCLNFVKVLDVTDELTSEQNEPVTRKVWEDWANEVSMQIMDKTIALIPKEGGKVRVKYNQHHVAVGSNRSTNFCWFVPVRSPRARLYIWLGEDRDTFIKKLTAKGMDVRPDSTGQIRMILTMEALKKNKNLIKEVLVTSEKRSS